MNTHVPERRALVVDDEMLIAVEVEFYLQEFGFSHIETLSSEQDAITWVQNNKTDVVILDIGLRNQMCRSLAELLVEKKVPFIIYSGYQPDEVDEIFHAGRWLAKPADVLALYTALKHIIPSLPSRSGEAQSG